MRFTADSGSPSPRKFPRIRSWTCASTAPSGSYTSTPCPCVANTWATPWPIKPAPTTAMRACAGIDLAGGVAAVDVDDLPRAEIRGGRAEIEQDADEVVGLAEPAKRDASKHPVTRALSLRVVG